MASIRRDEAVYASLADAPCGTRLVYNSLTALAGSLIAVTGGLTVRPPPAGAVGAAFKSGLLDLAPVAVGAGAAFTLVSCMARDARGVDDWVNPFYGGAAAGAIVGAVKRRTATSAIGAAVVLGFAGAVPTFWSLISPTVDELAPETRLDWKAAATSPQGYAATSQQATSVRKLL